MNNKVDLDDNFLKDYASFIESLARENKNEVFFNSCDGRALIVLKQIALSAKKCLKVYCGNLCSAVSNDVKYIEALTKFLEKDTVKMQILFANFSAEFYNKPIYQLLFIHRDKISLRKMLPNTFITKDQKPIHFTVGDSKMYRLETDIENKKAIGNFNDVTSALVLDQVFNNYNQDKFSQEVSFL